MKDLEEISSYTSEDGSTKIALRTFDNRVIEAICLPREHKD